MYSDPWQRYLIRAGASHAGLVRARARVACPPGRAAGVVSVPPPVPAVVAAALAGAPQHRGACHAAPASECVVCRAGTARAGDRTRAWGRRDVGCDEPGGSARAPGIRARAVGADGTLAGPVTGGTDPGQPLAPVCAGVDFAFAGPWATHRACALIDDRRAALRKR